MLRASLMLWKTRENGAIILGKIWSLLSTMPSRILSQLARICPGLGPPHKISFAPFLQTLKTFSSITGMQLAGSYCKIL